MEISILALDSTKNSMIEIHFLRLLGVIYFSFGLSAFIDPNYTKSLFLDLMKGKSFVFFAGILTTVLGYILIINTVESSLQYAVLVYILGIITFIKGLFLIVYPRVFTRITDIYTNKHVFNLIKFFLILVGGLCIYLTV